jgi:tetratricopeptide (TPR) repeat protein
MRGIAFSMARHAFALVARGIVIIVMGGALSGCVSLPTLWDLRDMPGFQRQQKLSPDQTVYDPSMRAYRRAEPRDGKETFTGSILTNMDWKKIRTEEELKRVLVAYKGPQIGAGTTIAAYGFAVVYSPIAAAETIAGAVLTLPLKPFLLYDEYQNRKRARHAIEEAYLKGRSYFETGKFQSALDQWDDAMRLDPWLRLLSDVNYWRGRTYERLGNGREALTAYLDFLDYSERSFPSYFEAPPKDDPPWPDKAVDTERRLKGLSIHETMATK